MKIQTITKDSHGHERFVFATKRIEMSIISALLANACRHTPPHPTTEIFRAQCRGMMKALDKALVLSASNQPPQPTTPPTP
jgi:hypothetical protein